MAETSPLRRRMIEDMTVRNLSPATQRSYVHAVSKFSRFFGRSPETLTLEDVRTFQVHLASKGVAWASLNQTVAAVPAALSRTSRRRLRRRRAALLRRSRSARRAPRLRRPLRGAAPDRLGGLRQAALRRPRAGAGLSRPLHPSRRHRQQPARRHDRRRRQLPLEGLPAGRPPQGHDARCRASSCAGSSCTSCPPASIASATSASSPMAIAQLDSRFVDSCWPNPSRIGRASATPSPTTTAAPRLVGISRSPMSALAAAASR